ncbi:MAG: hypothetical protein JSV44_05170 [Candidatus Zixiibacteriota bacterium]|nr:MAG: hypothetical protein JSV44_05170 [candidate division Zixibacteria bacterium]
MRKAPQIRLVLLAVVLIALIGSCRNDQLCCLEYQPQTDQATYCNNHRSAVGLFVLDVPDSAGTAASRERLEMFERFYTTHLVDCATVDCIESAIYSDTTMPEFIERYRTEHNFAERDTDIPVGQKAELILCGFQHAIEAFMETL